MNAPLVQRLGHIGKTLEGSFLGKEEVIRLMLICVVAGEHAVLIGPPGTAKSALIRTFAKLLQANYFEYLLTRFTEPNELFGPVDLAAFREGKYARRMEGMLPAAEIVFLDEIFKSNSAILNALLTLLNERRYSTGGTVFKCPLISAFGASNEVPADESLTAIFDRFLLRIKSDNLDAYHFQDLLQKGLKYEVMGLADAAVQPVCSAAEISELHRSFASRTKFGEDFFAAYKSIIFQIRSEGISVSDRRVVKMLKLFAANALLDGRAETNVSDLFVLKHIWNNEDQAAILEAIIGPIVDAFYRENPGARRVGSMGVGFEGLSEEVERIRKVLMGTGLLGDVQLFAQLKELSEIKSTLLSLPDPRSKELLQRVEQLLEASFKSGRFARI